MGVLEKFTKYRTEGKKRVGPLEAYQRLRNPVGVEDDVARFARCNACETLGFFLSQEDFNFVLSIRKKAKSEERRKYALWRAQQDAKDRLMNKASVRVFRGFASR